MGDFAQNGFVTTLHNFEPNQFSSLSRNENLFRV